MEKPNFSVAVFCLFGSRKASYGIAYIKPRSLNAGSTSLQLS